MSGAGPSAPGNEGEKHASIQARRRVSALGRRQPPASITLLLGQRRIAVAQAAQKRDPDPKPPDIWRMSVKNEQRFDEEFAFLNWRKEMGGSPQAVRCNPLAKVAFGLET